MYTKYILFTYFRAQCNDGYHDVPQKKNHPVAKEASSLTNKRNGRKFNQKNRTSETRKKLKRKDKAP